jgi:hypothetical protein
MLKARAVFYSLMMTFSIRNEKEHFLFNLELLTGILLLFFL